MLREHLVHAAHARRRSRRGVWNADELEDLLHGPVLAVASVHRDERHVGPRIGQPIDEVRPDVDRDHLVAETLQRVAHARAGAQRHLALERLAAGQHGDAAHPARRRSGTIRALLRVVWRSRAAARAARPARCR